MTQKEKDTALLNACKNIEENLGEVQQLIADGANINAVTPSGRMPIMLATAYGHTNIVRFLLENGANINAKDTNKGWTVLMFSTGIQNEELNVLTYFNIQKYMNKHFYTKKTVTPTEKNNETKL